ncbi:acyl-CoA-binding protein [Roseivirga misakiensis]|uniref:Acyl-CoA-binding protein n=1 Tax=Roseivirga misakiensis TaxID=1563681 RepID=A0A1E5T2F6_9BACT|nr:acyl-CoA-binding protein [Roseivirga misakiensis]OEK05573.1 acyl-CoA-binding protein [Roseivirga misakiensis]
MSLETTFENAVKASKTISERPSNQDLLKLYSLYKQATEGDNTNDAPGGFDFKGMAKHNAWNELSGTAKEDAMRQYIDLIDTLKSP